MSSSSESKSAPSRSTRRADGRAGTPGGARLRAIREQIGRSQLWVEAEADLGTGYLQRVESGRVAQPGRGTVEKILDALDARYSERRDVLELFGYLVATPLPSPAETEWARESCQRELHDVPFPAYMLDCYPRLVAWNRLAPRLLGDVPDERGDAPDGERGAERGERILAGLLGRSMLAPWFDPTSPLGALVAEPELFLPLLIRALRYEVERYRHEAWLEAMLTEVQSALPRFRAEWQRAEQEPAPISAARVLVPVKLAVPGSGLLQFRLVSEPLVRDARFRLIYYLPADPRTMRRCAVWASGEG
jgi:transcriptional regulator with XRE-family HTH domain